MAVSVTKSRVIITRSGVSVPQPPNLDNAQPPLNPDGVSVPRSFLDLNDTESSYVGQAGKIPKVKSDETGLEFGDASGGIPDAPVNTQFYARKDASWVAFVPFSVGGTPSEGDVVSFVSGVPTWTAPSGGGGSKWTDNGTGIIRNSAVAIGRNEIDPSVSLTVKAIVGSSFPSFRIRNSDDSILCEFQTSSIVQGRVVRFFSPVQFSSRISIESTGAASSGLFDARNNTLGGACFIGRNNTGVITFRVLQSGALEAGRGNFIGSNGGSWGAGILEVKTSQTLANENTVFRCVDNADNLIFAVARRWIRMNFLPTINPLVAGVLWNDSGTVKISAG